VISATDDAGFTIIELIVALVILTVGLLAFAGTTVFLIRQVTVAQLTTARTMAVQSVVEEIRATPYDSVATGTRSVGDYRVDWEAVVEGPTKAVTIISLGPGTALGRDGAVTAQAADTFRYRILQP